MSIVIWDLDGTIADTIEDLADACNYGLRTLGYVTHDYEEYKLFVGNGVKLLCERALPDESKDDTEKLLALFTEYYGKHFLDKTKLYPGIGEAMAELSENGVSLAVATNKPHRFAVGIVGKLLPEIRFMKILGGNDKREKKPSPRIIDEIIGNTQDRSRVFMAGDSSVDIMTAKNAKIRSIGCLWGFRSREELTRAGAGFLAGKPADIPGYVLK